MDQVLKYIVIKADHRFYESLVASLEHLNISKQKQLQRLFINDVSSSEEEWIMPYYALYNYIRERYDLARYYIEKVNNNEYFIIYLDFLITLKYDINKAIDIGRRLEKTYELYNSIGDELYNKQRIDVAIKWYISAYYISNKESMAIRIATIYYHYKHMEKAKQWAKRANNKGIILLITIYLKENRVDKAIELQKLLINDEPNGINYYNLAFLYEKKGDMINYENYINIALSLGYTRNMRNRTTHMDDAFNEYGA